MDIGYLRLFLPIYWTVYVLIAYVLPVRRFRREYGVDPERVDRPDPVMRLGERYRDGIFATTLLLTLAATAYPPALLHLGRVQLLEGPAVRVIGGVLLVAALLILRLGQRHMAESWRVGFDLDGTPTPLVVAGIYQFSRNPIYLGMGISAVGFFLVLPNAVTLTLAGLTIVLLQTRALVEERYLAGVHGERYAEYCRRTPRWLGLGRSAAR